MEGGQPCQQLEYLDMLAQDEEEEGDSADLGARGLKPGPALPSWRDRGVEELQLIHRKGKSATRHTEGDPRAGRKAGDFPLLAQDSCLPGQAVELPAQGDLRERGP